MAKKAEKKTKNIRVSIEKWREYFKYNIDQYHQMHQFVLGRQWADEEEDMLTKTLNKVPLQFNKLATLINSLLGEQQQNTPQIEVNPLSNCDEETSKIRQIVTKDIMMSNASKTSYQVAAKQAFVGGFGAFIIDTDYAHDKSFDQDIVYRYLKDATNAYWDLGADHINKIDGMYCGYLTRMTRKKFRKLYGKDIEKTILKDEGITASKEEVALAVQPDTTENPFSWNDGNSITIINHFERQYEKDMLYKLSNGEVLNQEELDDLIEKSKEHIAMLKQQEQQMQMMMGQMSGMDQMMGMPDLGAEVAEEAEEIAEVEEETDLELMTLYYEGEPVRIEDKKPSKKSRFIHQKMAGDYILEQTTATCEDCPVIFVDQNSFYDKNGKQVCRPFIIDAVDAQRYLNYLGTQSAYILKISRYDQYIGSKKNVQSLDVQQAWKDPTQVKGMLAYDESPSGAKPEQVRPPELSASLGQQYQRAIEDLYTSTGLYPTQLGQQGNEISGSAIDARTRQGSYSTYVAFNSINEAITAGGQIVNAMIPKVYDTERVMSLMMPDVGQKNVKINEQMDEYGAKIKNDIRKGSYEVKLIAGPSYEGQKAQALESLMMVMKADPTLFKLIADLYADNLPLANNREIKNRLKTIVPPEIIEAGKTGEVQQQEAQPTPEAQAAMAEAQFKMQQLEIKKEELKMKMQEHQDKMELGRMEMELKQLEYAASLEEGKMRYMAETGRTHSDNSIAHANNLTKLLIHHTTEKEKKKEQ